MNSMISIFWRLARILCYLYNPKFTKPDLTEILLPRMARSDFGVKDWSESRTTIKKIDAIAFQINQVRHVICFYS